jgi:hypothetical protein
MSQLLPMPLPHSGGGSGEAGGGVLPPKSIRPNARSANLGPMNKKPKRPAAPAPSKSFFRTKEEQQKIIEARKQGEATLIKHLEGILDKK